ncbi:MAG: RagB/SusD family nutrient uptake outer membrane protein, partial [Gemmatimonadota bacterium]|nr:RagB/SusD family nutrient uptake outer membrane protein [Gemmatimonadota bacterium]
DIEETNSNLQGLNRQLYQSRTAAEDAVRAYQRFAPSQIGHAESYNLAAATYMLFGEHYCSGVPFSRLTPEGDFEYGGQETTEQIFTRALNSADSAIAVATRAALPSNAAGTARRNEVLNTARVLKGRALLNLNRPADAALAVADVPANHRFAITHSENTAREYNNVFTFNRLDRRVSVANNEGINGLPYRDAFTAGDPRTPWNRLTPTARGFDAVTPQFNQLKYFNRSADVPLTTGAEALYIRAEAALRAGNVAQFETFINQARGAAAQGAAVGSAAGTLGAPASSGAALPALTSAEIGTTMDARINTLFRERAYTMWLTAHRMGDLRRLVRQYGRPQNQVFPTGAYFKAVQGGQYGSDVNFPLSVDERNNPEFANFPSNVSLCLNRDA